MINFQELELEVSQSYSFVGIKKQGLRAIFYLPKGFDINLFTTYKSKRDLFFIFYRVLTKFKNICLEKENNKIVEEIQTSDRDGIIRNSGSIQKISLPNFKVKEVIFYSKLDFLTSILEIYDEPKILSLAYRLGQSEKIDYNRLHLFLDRAVYLNNGAVYLDRMTLPRIEVHYQATDIIGMYCYLLVEIQQQLNQEISSEIASLAEKFKHKYISSEYELFSEEHNKQVIDNLKDTLEIIDKNTTLKDVDYWDYYDAIELFLYGELSNTGDGEVWGINNFWNIWESMCLTYIAKTLPPTHLLHLDAKLISSELLQSINNKPKVLNLTNAFKINNKLLMPDAVVYFNKFSIFYMEKHVFSFENNLKLNIKTWDDHRYRTMFVCNQESKYFEENSLRIAYEGQLLDRHTYVELEKYYKTSEGLIVSNKLPNNFYSFWKIDVNQLDSVVLELMYMLNHVFYVAIQNNLYTAKEFDSFLQNNFKVTSEDNVYNKSLFRDVASYTKLALTFEKFVTHLNPCLKIIDAKYLILNYFLNENNIRLAKERSVRKQFVYEYLLQQHIRSIKEPFKNLEIKSEFWIPEVPGEQKDCTQYLDGYISLKHIKYDKIIDSYLNIISR